MRRANGFTLVEMLVALSLLAVVGLALANFQTLQLRGSSRIADAALASIEADNRAADLLLARTAPAVGEMRGTVVQAGRTLAWRVVTGAGPSGLLRSDVVVAAGSVPLARRTVLRARG
ncbi:type II secretion system minor pseudopilin GspI [Sandaracinobacteroides saxicola]|uniref:Type II secretion system protein I n=1 Tax=Sandaracinobacteroides saxicola TaxID=2759707 RepID=A0A7G5IEF0_9SPHN|nr:type II secretion system minor pseudopilin GspI [Sandaracinobacteroides saxicola]QMW21742.1 type II secretion system minor pseudopilin GspI [Sandaracinobacteroides saxicola]